MYKLGLIGYPLSHSMSKVIQTAAFESTGLEGSYEILETPDEDLVTRIKYLKSHDYAGFNVTIPHKVPITLFLSDVDDVANITGSANTIKIMSDYSLKGYNTDVYGFVTAIPENVQKELKGESVAVFGAGGAARAVGVGLCSLNVSKIVFYVRNIINASDVVYALRQNFPAVQIECKQTESLSSLSPYKMVVNATPLGMRGLAQDCMPVKEEYIMSMREGSVVYDIVYNPLKTELIKAAKRHGLQTIQGLDMLIYQGAKAFEIWTGKKPDVLKMKLAALEEMVN